MLDASIPLSGRSPQFMTLGDTLKLAGDLQSDKQQKKLRQQAIAENDFQTAQRQMAQGQQAQEAAVYARHFGGLTGAPAGPMPAPPAGANTLGSLGGGVPSGGMPPVVSDGSVGQDVNAVAQRVNQLGDVGAPAPAAPPPVGEMVTRGLAAQGMTPPRDYTPIIQELYARGDVPGAQKAEARMLAERKAYMEDRKGALDNVISASKGLGYAAGNMTDQKRWDEGKAWIAEKMPEVAASIPAEYSPANQQALQRQGMDAFQQATVEGKKADDELNFYKAKVGQQNFETTAAETAQYHRDTAGTAAATRAEAARHNRVIEGQGAQRLKTDAAATAPTPAGVTGDEAMKGVDPNVARVVKQVAEYKIPLPSGFALRSPYWQNVLSLAAAYDPTFDATQYTVRLQLRKDMTSGKSANNIKSFNTAIAHLDTLEKRGEELHNRSFTPWNTLANLASQKTGNAAVTNFLAAADAVSAEAATAFKGTAGTDQEIKAWRGSLDANMSPEQIDGAIGTITELLAGRIRETNSQYERGMGKPKDFHFLSDKSRAILGKRKVDVNEIDPAGAATAPASSTTPPAATGGGTVKMSLGGVEKDVAPGRVEAIKTMGGTVVGQAATPAPAGPAANPQKAQLEQQIRALAAQVQAERDPAKQAALKAQGQRLLQQFDAVK